MANFEELKQLLAQRGGGDLGAGMRNLVSPPQPSKWDEIKKYLAMGEETPLPQEDQAIQDLRAKEPQVTQAPQEAPTKPMGIGQTQEVEQTPAPNPYSDKEKEELDWQNSTGYKILKVLGSGASGFGGAKPSDISNAWNSTENHRLNRAREENLRSPDSQISQHFRELASMYSDPKEFTVTPAQSAKDIMEAMPWLAQHLGLDIKSQLAEAKLRGGGGKRGVKLRPIEQATYTKVSEHEAAGETARGIIELVENNPSLISFTKNAMETGKGWVGQQDADWQVLNTELEILRQQLAKTYQGGVLSNQDNALFKRVLPGSGATPETVKAVVNQLVKNSKIRATKLLMNAKRAGRDTSEFDDAYGLNTFTPETESTSTEQATVKILFPDGSSMDSPSGQVDNILKKYPGAKVGK